MAEEHVGTIDLLALLAEDLERIVDALESAPDKSPYVEGQLAYLQSLGDALERVGADGVPRDLLERVAADLGVEVQDGDLAPSSPDPHETGVLSMWSFALGYVEGAATGIRAAADVVDERPGASASTWEE